MQLIWYIIGFRVVFSLICAEALVSSSVVGLQSLLICLIISFKLKKSIVFKHIQFDISIFIGIKLVFLTAWMNWIFHFKGQTGSLEEENGRGGTSEHDGDDKYHDNFLQSSALGRSILPDNISWLRSCLDVNFVTEEGWVILLHVLVTWAFVARDCISVFQSSLLTFFALKSSENGAWVLKFIEKLTVWLFNCINNFLVKLIDFLILLGNDQSTSLLKPIDDLSIVVGKGDLSNLDRVLWFTRLRFFLEAKIRHRLDSLFQFDLNIQLELRDAVHRVSLIIVVFLEVVEHIFINIEFDSVVSGGDGLDVKVEEFVDLYALDVVEVDNSPQVNEHSDGSRSKTVNHSVGLVLLWDFTGILDKEIGLFVALWRNVFICRFVHVIQGQIIEVASVLALALLLNIGIEPVFVKSVSASLESVIVFQVVFGHFIDGRVDAQLVVSNILVDKSIFDSLMVNPGLFTIGA